MSEMTSRERMMTTMRRRIPDQVLAAPDISNMVPCQLTKKPFWDVYINENPPLWKAYIDAVRHYGMDGWFIKALFLHHSCGNVFSLIPGLMIKK